MVLRLQFTSESPVELSKNIAPIPAPELLLSRSAEGQDTEGSTSPSGDSDKMLFWP